MASADLREELSCSICLNIYTDPVTLRCGHNFCRVCIDRVLDTQEASAGFSCPECREAFRERPELRKNTTLCNIAEKMLPAQTQQGPGGPFCTNCIHAHVPASKSCLHCEVHLCSDHLRIHSKSPEHVLLDPSTSLENRKCSVHRELLRYFCVRDDICICVSCSLAGQHRGHHVSMLEEASMKKKENLRKVLQNLTSKSQEVKKIIEGLQEKWRKTQEKTADIKQRATAAFRDIRSLVEILKEEVLAEISQQEQQGSHSVSDLIQQLEAKRDDLARKVLHVSELFNMADPLTVLQDLETRRGDFGDMKHVDDVNLDISHKKVYAANHLDENPIHAKIQTVSSVLEELKCGVCIWGPTEISLDKTTAGNSNNVSDDLKSVSSNHQEYVMSTRSFSSGTHYWEVEFKGSGSVGVCYAAVSFKGSQSGDSEKKSWWLRQDTDGSTWTRKTHLTMIHHNWKSQIPFSASSSRFRIFLDYEAGRISFYELGDPIRHLHTFTAKFTEPLRAAFCVCRTTLRIM